jgi:hypothetical protein
MVDWSQLMRAGQAGLAALLSLAADWEREMHDSPAGVILPAVLATTLIFAVLALKRDRAHD